MEYEGGSRKSKTWSGFKIGLLTLCFIFLIVICATLTSEGFGTDMSDAALGGLPSCKIQNAETRALNQKVWGIIGLSALGILIIFSIFDAFKGEREYVHTQFQQHKPDFPGLRMPMLATRDERDFLRRRRM